MASQAWVTRASCYFAGGRPVFNIAQVIAAAQDLLGGQELNEHTRAFIDSLSEPGSGITQDGGDGSSPAASPSASVRATTVAAAPAARQVCTCCHFRGY
jgi:hypothetical protein